jgi:hypothetical protein
LFTLLSLQNVGRANVITSPRLGTVALISIPPATTRRLHRVV